MTYDIRQIHWKTGIICVCYFILLLFLGERPQVFSVLELHLLTIKLTVGPLLNILPFPQGLLS